MSIQNVYAQVCADQSLEFKKQQQTNTEQKQTTTTITKEKNKYKQSANLQKRSTKLVLDQKGKTSASIMHPVSVPMLPVPPAILSEVDIFPKSESPVIFQCSSVTVATFIG